MLACLLACVLSAAAGGDLLDQVLLKDGRLLEGKIENRNDGMYLTLVNDTVRVPDDEIQETCLVNMDSYVPKDDFEKEQLKKGLVLHKGTWISKARYDTMLSQRMQKRRKQIEDMRARQDWFAGKTEEATKLEALAKELDPSFDGGIELQISKR